MPSPLLRFLKDWTLPVAMMTGTLGYFLFSRTPGLEGIARWYAPLNGRVLPCFMFLVLYVTFCKMDFRRMRPVRWHAQVGLAHVGLTLGLTAPVLLLGLEGRPLILTEAVLACAIGPCASAAAVVTAKLEGDLEEMTAYTLLSNIVSALLIPLCFPLLPRIGGMAEVRFFPLFLDILWKVSLVLLLPMGLALVTRSLLPEVHRRVVGVKDLSYYLWAAALVVVTGTTAMNITEAWAHTPPAFLLLVALASLLLCLLQYALGRMLGRPLGRMVEAGQSLGQKNTTFSIWVATAFLHPLSSVGPGCYILWQNTINSLQIGLHARKRA